MQLKSLVNKKILFISFVLLIVFLSLVLRSVEVLNKNYVFGFDQGRDYLAVKSIIVDHKITLIGSEIGGGYAGLTGIFHGPFYYYLLGIPFILFQGDPYGGMVLMFLFGLSAIIFGFYFGEKLFGRWGGLIAALLIAISPPLVSQSRLIWNTSPAPFFILVAFYFIYLLFKNKERYFFLAAFFSGFTYNFDIAFAIPISFSLFIYCLFILKIRQLRKYFWLFLGFLLAFLPMIIFELRHHLLSFQNVTGYIFSRHEKLIGKNYLNDFLFNFGDTFPRQTLIPTLLVVFVVFLSAIYFLRKEKNGFLRNFIIYLLMLPLMSFFIFFLVGNPVYSHYLFHLNLTYILIFSYAIFSAFKKKNFFLIFFLTGFLFLVILRALPDSIYTFRTNYHDAGGIAKNRGKVEAIDYIYQDAKGKNFSLFIFTPPVYTYAYDYLIWWYGEGKYHYKPAQEKKGLFYLLIEVDYSKPWSYQGWLETVIKSGTIIETKELPSGFIIQKRIGEENAI